MVEAAVTREGLQDGRALRGDGLPLPQRDAEPVRRGRQDPVRRRQARGAGVLPAAREPEHGVLPLAQGAPRLPGREGVLRAGGAREVPVRVHPEAQRPRLLEEVPLRDVPRRVQVLHELHAEDLRRQALPRALRGPRRDDGPRPRRRRPEARDRARRGDHLGPLPAGDPHVPQHRQGAARRARLVLPAAHRRQHGVDLARHQLVAAAVQARRRRGAAAVEHPRVGRADQADREPVLAASSRS